MIRLVSAAFAVCCITIVLFGAVSAEAKELGITKVATAVQPTSLSSPPGYPRLAFVTERRGTIRLLRQGKLVKRPLLNLIPRVNSVMIERGLLGLAFAPDFQKTGRFYVHFTGKAGFITIEEFRTVPGRPAQVRRDSRRLVLRIAPVRKMHNHNGGQLAFRDNQLYISVGDGTNPGDIAGVAQNRNSLRGKILRIDPRRDVANKKPYRIPADNPFVGKAGRDEIFAYGLRNPHSFSFSTTESGTPMISIFDVGQGRFEELNYLSLEKARGANFGWKSYEGLRPYNCGKLCPNGGPPKKTGAMHWPQLVYSHKQGCAIIGGPVINDPSLTTARGRIIYGDFCTNRVRTSAPRVGKITDDGPAGFFLPPGQNEFPALNGFGVDGLDRVYAFTNFGAIYRLVQR